MNANVVTRLNELFPGRKKQINELCRLFDQEDQDAILPRQVMLEGSSGSGRTAILKKLMDLKNEFYIFINCIECYTTRLLHFHLLYGLFEKLEDVYEEIDSLGIVYEHFQKFGEKLKLRCIIFKNSDQLNAPMVEKLCRFQETLLSNGWNFSLVFVSDDPVNILGTPIFPVRILFPRYTKDELMEILCVDIKKESAENLEIFRNFLNFLLPAITPIYSRLHDIRKLVNKFFPVYRKPIDDGTRGKNEVRQLIKLLEESINLKNMSMMMYSYADDDHNAKIRDIMDLPMASKYLLVASFLASFIPQKNDKIFMVKTTKKKKTLRRIKKATERSKLLLGGPKPFDFARLMLIYEAVSNEKLVFNVNLISKVAALLELRLIVLQKDQRENLNEPSYKCVTNPSTVYTLAKNIDIDLDNYLSSV